MDKTIQWFNRTGSTQNRPRHGMVPATSISAEVEGVGGQPVIKLVCMAVVPEGSLMVWGCMIAAGTGGLQFIEGTMNTNVYCDILKQNMIPPF